MRVVCDIETDSLNATVIHCIVCKDIDSGEVYKFVQEDCYDVFAKFADGVDHWVGHNFLSFDAPVLNRLSGTRISTGRITDTLLLSRLDKPDRELPEKLKKAEADLPKDKRSGPHSLKAWGFRSGSYKIDFHEFEYYTPEMLEYCVQDVELCFKVYRYLVDRMKNFSDQSIRMEHTVRMIMNQQQDNGVAFDMGAALEFQAELNEEKARLEAEVHKVMRPLAKAVREVNLSYTKEGTLFKNCVKPIGTDETVIGGDYTIVDFPKFKLSSRQQIANQLIRKGWKPKVFTPSGQAQIDEKILEKVKIPEAQLIARYMMVQKRHTDVTKWIRFASEDPNGRVRGYVNSLGANTNRMTHREPNMSQVTSVDKPYGVECRSLFIARSSDRVLLGTDASGLEARCLAHRINDAEFTKSIIESDIHTFNQQFFGLPKRNDAKPVYYCLVYGGGDVKFGSVIGGGAKEGAIMRKKYYGRFPNLKTIQDNYAEFEEGDLLKAIDGRYVNVRSAHSALNLDLQSMGAIICKYWMIEVYKDIIKYKLDALQILQVHDELQYDVHKDHAEKLGECTKLAMKRVEKLLNMNCPLDSEYKVGANWSVTH